MLDHYPLGSPSRTTGGRLLRPEEPMADTSPKGATGAKAPREPWIIRTYAGFGDAIQANRRFRNNLNEGQRGLSIAFDLPTQNGYDPDAPVARGEVGEAGVSICHWQDMERLFEGPPLHSINPSMPINAPAPFILALISSSRKNTACRGPNCVAPRRMICS